MGKTVPTKRSGRKSLDLKYTTEHGQQCGDSGVGAEKVEEGINGNRKNIYHR